MRANIRIFAIVSVLAGAPAASAAADPIVVNFDALQGDNELVPAGYGGIDWLDTWTHYGFSQPPYTAHSSPQRVYASGKSGFDPFEASFAFTTPNQLFTGAWFAGYSAPRDGDVPTFIRFNLYDDGARVFSSGVLTPSDRPGFLASGYFGRVDRVGVAATRGFWVMDDVTYGATPEPGTLLLLGSAAAALALRRRSA